MFAKPITNVLFTFADLLVKMSGWIVGEEKEVIVSKNFREQLTNESFFSKLVFKLKSIIASSLNIDQLALKYRKEYCKSKEAREDFDALMLRLGIDIEKLLSKEEV